MNKEQGAGGTPSSSSTTNVVASSDSKGNANNSNSSVAGDPMDAAVLAYLKKKGLTNAANELTKALKNEDSGNKMEGNTATSSRERLELEEAEVRSQRTVLAHSSGGGFGYDADSGPLIPQWGVPDHKVRNSDIGVDEARAHVNAFVELQTWVLGLPDESSVSEHRNSGDGGNYFAMQKDNFLSSILKQRAGENNQVPENVQKDLEQYQSVGFVSAKPELLAVTFALLVHTYCELLEVGMESTAHSLLGTFRPIYDQVYATELADLEKCGTTAEIVTLNLHNASHKDALNNLKSIMVQVANLQLKADELKTISLNSKNLPADQQASRMKFLGEYEKHIRALQRKYDEVAKEATKAFDKIQGYPFLRRARVVRWQLSLSASTYDLLSRFLSSSESIFTMNTLLLNKCELLIEKRPPLSQIPPCIILEDDNSTPSRKRARVEVDVSWAAPLERNARQREAGEQVQIQDTNLPFPRFYREDEYESAGDAARDKLQVEFNRNILIHGFRRLEALERKREYESGIRTATTVNDDDVVNPLEPSILLSTLCSSSSPGPNLVNGRTVDATSIWHEPGVCLTCASVCPPDGRRVAAGCDDAAVRIWSAMRSHRDNDDNVVKEASMVLLGHKNGFPVFDVDWNRDGRTLASAGGDGSIRLWDTHAKGTFGAVAPKLTSRPSSKIVNSATEEAAQEEGPGMTVPGIKPETVQDINGAALAVYRGHTPSCPVWSVSFAPCGYYFASSAADATGRIWVTDRPTPIRVLSGHTSASVNTIEWHPNCNYVLTGCNDKTIRMWDIHTGRYVRLLNGCSSGINALRVSPSGQYVAGAEYNGNVYIWDLGTGKKVATYPGSATIHSLAYSTCGNVLATGGDDCVVNIWNVQGTGSKPSPLTTTAATESSLPYKTFATRRTMLLDLQFTKRNLLLAAGKFVTPVPLL